MKGPGMYRVFQFLVVLIGTDPLVWRRIQVPEQYSFWDLHVAIQDAMGWQDSHLHEFQVLRPSGRKVDLIGIPDDESLEERPLKPGWKTRIAQYFDWETQPALYVYDFGDNWRHIIQVETLDRAMPSVEYPKCLGGARRCPPEDCGGLYGYQEFLAAISDPTHPEHHSHLEWVGGSYDPDDFDPARVVFDDPHERWVETFEEG